jgi:hypothetical protein
MGSWAWKTAPAVVEHPEGTRVAPPVKPWGCWATTLAFRKMKTKAPRSCLSKARGGALTCQSHRAIEAEARALKVELEGSKGRVGAGGK